MVEWGWLVTGDLYDLGIVKRYLMANKFGAMLLPRRVRRWKDKEAHPPILLWFNGIYLAITSRFERVFYLPDGIQLFIFGKFAADAALRRWFVNVWWLYWFLELQGEVNLVFVCVCERVGSIVSTKSQKRKVL